MAICTLSENSSGRTEQVASCVGGSQGCREHCQSHLRRSRPLHWGRCAQGARGSAGRREPSPAQPGRGACSAPAWSRAGTLVTDGSSLLDAKALPHCYSGPGYTTSHNTQWEGRQARNQPGTGRNARARRRRETAPPPPPSLSQGVRRPPPASPSVKAISAGYFLPLCRT